MQKLATIARLIAAITIVAVLTSQNAFAENESPHKPPQVLPLDDAAYAGKLISVDDNWNLTFEADSKRRTFSAADLIRWGRPAALKRGPIVVLADGGLLRADAIDYNGTVVKIESAIFGDVILAGEEVAGIAFEFPFDTVDADRLLDWAATANNLVADTKRPRTEGNGGRIRLLNGDVLSGRILAADTESVRIETEVGPVTIELGRVEAIRFARPLIKNRPVNAESAVVAGDEPDQIQAWAGLADGSLLLVRRLELDAQKLAITLSGSTSDQAGEWIASPTELVFLQPMGPKITYLSDLAAAEYRHVPYLQLPWPYGIDRNTSGGRLRSGGRLFIKGLGTHSSARLTYLLDQPYSRFEASTAIDDSTAGRGSVRFRVYVDGKKKFSGQTVRGHDVAVPISVDIRGAKRLDLIVDFADRAGQDDHANWLEARLVR